MKHKEMRDSAILLLLITVCLVALMRQPELTTLLSINTGVVALNNAYDQPESSTRLLQVAQMRLIKAESIGEVGWAQAGLTFLLQNNLPEAENAWKQSDLPAESLLQYALQARQLGFPQTAFKICELLIKIAPTFRDSWYLEGDIYASRGEYKTALATFQDGLMGTEYGNWGQSDLYFRMGEIYALFLPDTDLATAQIMYAQAIEKNDFRHEADLIRTRYLHGEAYRVSGNPIAAMAEYEQLLFLNPNHYWANIRLGRLVWSETKSLADAEILLQRAITSNEQEKGAYRALGAIYLENGRFLDARVMFETILTLDPTDTHAIQALETLQTKQP